MSRPPSTRKRETSPGVSRNESISILPDPHSRREVVMTDEVLEILGPLL